jgi:hypothetical protein
MIWNLLPTVGIGDTLCWYEKYQMLVLMVPTSGIIVFLRYAA